MNRMRGAQGSMSSAMICAVMVVPMDAPSMMYRACERVIIWALTKPTAMTIVAPELWMAAVASAPTRTAFRGLVVSFSSQTRRLSPAACSRPLPM